MNTILAMSALHGLMLGAQLVPQAPVISTPVNTQTVIHLMSADGALTGAKVNDNGNLIGLVGDFAAFSSGAHRLVMQAAQGYTLEIGLTVDANGARVTDSLASPRECGTIYEVKWSAPTISSTAKKGPAAAPPPDLSYGGWVLKIATPTFGAARGKAGCIQPMLLSCSKKYATVRFASDPKGAEIWIGSEKQDAAAPSILSVPFCEKRDVVHVMLRAPGMTTCPRDIKLSSAAQVDVQCILRAPSKPGALEKK